MFEKIGKQWVQVDKQLREECMDYFKKTVSNRSGHICWDVDELKEIGMEFDAPHISFAGNLAMVYGISVGRGGELRVDIEECLEYDASRIDTGDMYDLAKFLKHLLKEREKC